MVLLENDRARFGNASRLKHYATDQFMFNPTQLRLRNLAIAIAVVFCVQTILGPTASAEDFETYDIVIYGGTSAAITAAVEAKRKGKSVVIVCPDKHLGGLSSGGLGWTDSGNKAVIGGLSREFYHRVWKHYQQPEAWRWQEREDYKGRGQGTAAIDGEQRTMWIFEPHVAEQVFDEWVVELGIPVLRDEWLDRESGVKLLDGRIQSITTLGGRTFAGKIFMDATYEGDLMAAAGVSYHVGREANSVYDEKWNGVQTGVLHHNHHFATVDRGISPYVTPGDPSSGLLPRISDQPPGEYGAGDKRIQAYCFRMCLTNAPENRIPFFKPDGYDPQQYELLVRLFEAGLRSTFNKFDPIPNHKTDTNNHGPFSTDNIGYNYDYPEATYERRREIIHEHETYQKGWLYFIATDPRVPKEIQEGMSSWGLAKDEFQDNGGWPHQLYIREARRMIGRFVMTENELLKRRETPESIGMGSYTMDSHNVQRYVKQDGFVQNEGDIGVKTRGPYKIAYGSIVPRHGECPNLFVPVCVSSSHIAFGSIRMEPVFMLLGHSAATAACIAIDDQLAVQDVPYEQLRKELLAEGQVLEWTGPIGDEGTGANWSKLPGTVVDDEDAELTGSWMASTSSPKWIGECYRHDRNVQDGSCSAIFKTRLGQAGVHEVRLAYTPNANRSSRVEVIVTHAGGTTTKTINQRTTPEVDGYFVSLGEFDFAADTESLVTVSNRNSNGYVVIDAVQWLSQDQLQPVSE